MVWIYIQFSQELLAGLSNTILESTSSALHTIISGLEYSFVLLRYCKRLTYQNTFHLIFLMMFFSYLGRQSMMRFEPLTWGKMLSFSILRAWSRVNVKIVILSKVEWTARQWLKADSDWYFESNQLGCSWSASLDFSVWCV